MIESPHMPSSLAVLGEKLRMSYRQLPAALGLGIVLAFVCAGLFYDRLPLPIIAGWIVILIAITAIRYIALRPIASLQFKDEDSPQYARRYLVTALLLGSIWGTIAFTMPLLTVEYRVFVYVLLISIAGGALSSNAGLFSSYVGYVVPMLTMLALQSFLLTDSEWSYLGMLILLYMAFITSAAHKLNNSLHESVTHRFRWQMLADELEETRKGLNQELSERQHTERRLKKVMGELEQAVKHLEHLSTTDELTGLANRRSFDIALSREWNRARRHKGNVALLMIDVDRFKDFNDIYHHQLGDEALKQVARALEEFANRPGDVAARYGGEEFALILSNPTDAHMQDVAENLRIQVKKLQIAHSGSDVDDYLTISIGAAMIKAPDYDDYSPLVSAADAALYKAKQSGRNRVCIA